MNDSCTRRRLLAGTVPALLAGCLVESGEGGDGGDGGASGSTGGEAGGADDGGSDAGSGESAGSDGETTEAAADDSTAEQTDGEPAPDSLGPEGSGLVVTSAEVLGVSDDGGETTVDARLTVENRGRYTYGTVEFRVDAYATVPNTNERDEVGFAYVTRRFLAGDRFEDGTRRFDVSIAFRSSETNVQSDADWYRVDAAVRRADPV